MMMSSLFSAFLCIVIVVLLKLQALPTCSSFIIAQPNTCRCPSPSCLLTNVIDCRIRPPFVRLSSQQDDDDDDANNRDNENNKEEEDDSSWDKDVNYNDFFDDYKSDKNPNTDWDSLDDDDSTPKLGIDIGSQLIPLTEEEAEQLKQDAAEVIEKGVQKGLDDIARLRKNMERDLEQSRKTMQVASELNTQQEKEKLLQKIDSLTSDFLTKSKSSRTDTKMAAQADQAMQNKGLTMGSWGLLENANVVMTTDDENNVGIIGSVDSAQGQQQEQRQDNDDEVLEVPTRENRILIVADTSLDKTAKQLVPALRDLLEDANIIVEIVQPTSTMPLGGNNAQCLVVFAPSLSDVSVLKNSILNRVLKRTMGSGGTLGIPPSQIVLISSLGTTRINKYPYGMQNLLGGSKLEKQLQMEESLVNVVQNRIPGDQTPLDYTIIKLGELKQSQEEFEMKPGDVLDGSISAEVASQLLMQSIAFQPLARNATLCAVGGVEPQTNWGEWFLPLDGPELYRCNLVDLDASSEFDILVEYLREWADLLVGGETKLTTPVRSEYTQAVGESEFWNMQKGVKLVFLPTRTGKSYYSKSEERAREAKFSSGGTSESSSAPPPQASPQTQPKEGGVEVMVEVVTADANQLRVRAKRCNMDDDTTIKELSEATILKRLKDALEVFVHQQQQEQQQQS